MGQPGEGQGLHLLGRHARVVAGCDGAGQRVGQGPHQAAVACAATADPHLLASGKLAAYLARDRFDRQGLQRGLHVGRGQYAVAGLPGLQALVQP